MFLWRESIRLAHGAIESWGSEASAACVLLSLFWGETSAYEVSSGSVGVFSFSVSMLLEGDELWCQGSLGFLRGRSPAASVPGVALQSHLRGGLRSGILALLQGAD